MDYRKFLTLIILTATTITGSQALAGPEQVRMNVIKHKVICLPNQRSVLVRKFHGILPGSYNPQQVDIDLRNQDNNLLSKNELVTIFVSLTSEQLGKEAREKGADVTVRLVYGRRGGGKDIGIKNIPHLPTDVFGYDADDLKHPDNLTARYCTRPDRFDNGTQEFHHSLTCSFSSQQANNGELSLTVKRETRSKQHAGSKMNVDAIVTRNRLDTSSCKSQ